jgi:hypothetical protein
MIRLSIKEQRRVSAKKGSLLSPAEAKPPLNSEYKTPAKTSNAKVCGLTSAGAYNCD